MQPGRYPAFKGLVKPVMSGFLALLLLFLSSAAASSALHHSFHPDANAPAHSCVVSLFAKGQVNSAPVVVALFGFVSQVTELVFLPKTSVFPSADYRYSASRAPPVLTSPATVVG